MLFYRFQAETATDLIAIDRFATSYPNEKIILSSDIHECDIEAKDNLHYIIKQHLQETLDWFNDCQVNMPSYCIGCLYAIAPFSVAGGSVGHKLIVRTFWSIEFESRDCFVYSLTTQNLYGRNPPPICEHFYGWNYIYTETIGEIRGLNENFWHVWWLLPG